jgi:hypothetical protein
MLCSFFVALSFLWIAIADVAFSILDQVFAFPPKVWSMPTNGSTRLFGKLSSLYTLSPCRVSSHLHAADVTPSFTRRSYCMIQRNSVKHQNLRDAKNLVEVMPMTFLKEGTV